MQLDDDDKSGHSENNSKKNKKGSGQAESDSEDKSGQVLELLSDNSQEANNSKKKHYLVKFKGLQYDEATWEDAEMVQREYPEL